LTTQPICARVQLLEQNIYWDRTITGTEQLLNKDKELIMKDYAEPITNSICEEPISLGDEWISISVILVAIANTLFTLVTLG